VRFVLSDGKGAVLTLNPRSSSMPKSPPEAEPI
jgi:hypothetical protein